jgi:3-phenylpropionate/trans-cinnamate dioxygenase ferredoxin reductase subunit
MSDFMLRAHEEHGVAFAFGRKVVALHETDGVVSVELDGGERLLCDLVVVGIGVIPNTELAADCGLQMAGGVLVDECAHTSDPSIVAAGDCASFVPHWAPPGTRACRIESVQNANDMAKTAAASVVGRSEPYRALPWFWSDQYDLKLQMAGVNVGFTDYAVRGSVEERKFSLFYIRDDKLIAVDSINRPQDHMLARKLLASGARVTPEHVRDSTFDLKTLASPDVHAARGAAQ